MGVYTDGGLELSLLQHVVLAQKNHPKERFGDEKKWNGRWKSNRIIRIQKSLEQSSFSIGKTDAF